MKKTLFLFAALIVSATIFANPAKKVEMTYDKATGELKIVVTHIVKDPKTHYIDVITVEINGTEVKKETYTQQTSTTTQEVTIKLENVKIGEEIKVNTNCNKSGKKSGVITIN